MKTLKIVPAFDGHENVTAGIEQYRECAETLREDKQSMLQLALSGEAAVIFRGFNESTRKDFEKSAEVLTEAFAPSPRLSRASFASSRLENGKSVDYFMADLKRMAVRICGFAGSEDAFVAQVFINGLPEAAMKSVEAEVLGKAQDLDWLVRLARIHVKVERRFTDVIAAVA